MEFKKVNQVKKVLGVVGILAFLYVVGVAGSSDLDTLSLGASAVRALLGLTVMWGCIKADAYLDVQVAATKEVRQTRRALKEVKEVKEVKELKEGKESVYASVI